jgi:hypothetical protein
VSMALYKELEKLPHKSRASMADPLQEKKFFGSDNNGATLMPLSLAPSVVMTPHGTTQSDVEEAKVSERQVITDGEPEMLEPIVLSGFDLKRVVDEQVKESIKKHLGAMCTQFQAMLLSSGL